MLATLSAKTQAERPMMQELWWVIIAAGIPVAILFGIGYLLYRRRQGEEVAPRIAHDNPKDITSTLSDDGQTSRAYLVINVVKHVDQDDYFNAVSELEAMPEVIYVDPVAGSHDLVVAVKATPEVSVTVNEIRAKEWVEDLKVQGVLPANRLEGET